MWRQRIGAVGRWGLLTISAVVVVVGLLSRWFSAVLWLPGGRDLQFSSGAFWLFTDTSTEEPSPRGKPYVLDVYATSPRSREIVWTFCHFHERGTGYAGWVVPLWAPLILLAGTNAIAWHVPVRARLRRRRGDCSSCGYDRRGLAATAACPECGAGPAGYGRIVRMSGVGGGIGEAVAMWRRRLGAAIRWSLLFLAVQTSVLWAMSHLPTGRAGRIPIDSACGIVARFAVECFALSLWALAAVAWQRSVLSRTRRAIEGHRRRRGLCGACRYDRRGLPTGQACPECGAVPADCGQVSRSKTAGGGGFAALLVAGVVAGALWYLVWLRLPAPALPTPRSNPGPESSGTVTPIPTDITHSVK